GPSRSKSKDSLLESESQFIAVDDPAIPASKTDLQPRQPSARERRRWKQLEEMAKEPKPYDTYKPPTPGGFSLNSVTSFNVDEVATKNEERLKRLQAIQRAGGGGGGSNPDDVLKQFMSERGRPLTRTSEASLEAESSYEPVLNY
ncbi:Centrosome and spindle pole-associated protein 1, partial [Exaiptasia diaphana]